MTTTETEARTRLPVRHLTMAERVANGRAARDAAPRSSHGRWEPAPVRRDPIELLEAQAATRLQELVPIRYGRMLVSPFTFYRGAAGLMAADLAGGAHTGLVAQLCGDAHLANFGGFAAPDRRLVFSINDFDETLPGPFEWDLKRLVASFAVAGRDRGFDVKQRESVNVTVSRSYRDAMKGFAAMRTLDIWYARLDVDRILLEWAASASSSRLKQFNRNVAKARAHDSLSAFKKLTHVVNGERRILARPPLIVPVEDLYDSEQLTPFEETVRRVTDAYRQTISGDHQQLIGRFRYVHAARKVVGVGSVGARAWIVLMVGNDGDDPLVLQMKEAEASVLEPFLGASEFATHGQRVVVGQRMMQAASDIMLGWAQTPGIDGVRRDFYIRQLWDGKGSALVETMDPRTMRLYASLCGWTLARAHARSGDAVAISAYLGASDGFDEALASFAELYADQNERDYAALREAADAGVVAVLEGL
jgi:uncharacterized protein (DUF2252 family)